MHLYGVRKVIGGHARGLAIFSSTIPRTLGGRLAQLAYKDFSSFEALLLCTTIAVFSTYWYLRRMAPDRSAGTDTAPEEKNVKVFASVQSESYG